MEERHMPPFHRFATGRVGGKSTPVLVTEVTFTDSTDILARFHRLPTLSFTPLILNCADK